MQWVVSDPELMPAKTFAGRYESLAKIGKLVAGVAKEAGFDSAHVYEIQLAVDEACTNIIEHGYGGEGKGEIYCNCEKLPDGIRVTLHDWAAPFNPDSVPPPNFDVPLEELKSRGAGLHLMKKLMDEVTFKFDTPEGNVCVLVKRK